VNRKLKLYLFTAILFCCISGCSENQGTSKVDQPSTVKPPVQKTLFYTDIEHPDPHKADKSKEEVESETAIEEVEPDSSNKEIAHSSCVQTRRCVPEDYPTIMSAIAAADEGDTVLIAPGDYHENITINGPQSITVGSRFLISQNGEDIYNTRIIGDGSTSVISIMKTELSPVAIVGLTVQGGAARYGGGFHIVESNPHLSNLIIARNKCRTGGGGGIYCFKSSILLENSLLYGNYSADVGGGYYGKEKSQSILRNVIFMENVGTTLGGAAYLRNWSDTVFEDVLFIRNRCLRGSALALKYESKALASHCLFINPGKSFESVVYSGKQSSTILLQSTVEMPFTGYTSTKLPFTDEEAGFTSMYNSVIGTEQVQPDSVRAYSYESLLRDGRMHIKLHALSSYIEPGFYQPGRVAEAIKSLFIDKAAAEEISSDTNSLVLLEQLDLIKQELENRGSSPDDSDVQAALDYR